ncbi:hypothetical protein PNOK_0817900 [Pyrrhoderma noxium]|uniref:Uncharacterized protein n=1 Tax=Pyrrhoderma noxium TaxID=2282107 RepID=A0A286UAG7_9AGAM|nr:hypothetical protein PNOK_0817900 [Pyrrhoderma noxium]
MVVSGMCRVDCRVEHSRFLLYKRWGCPMNDHESRASLISLETSRAASVVSNPTGDSALIEAKERREWPPRKSEATQSPAENGKSATQIEVKSSSTTTASEDISESRSYPLSPDSSISNNTRLPVSLSSSISNPDTTEVSQTEVVKNEANIPDEVLKQEIEEVTPVKKPRIQATGKITATKSNPVSGTPARTTARAPRAKSPVPQSKSTPPTPSKGAPVAKPLKAQNTGTSSSTTAARARAGAKSPLAARAKTPNVLSMRTKTPTPMAPTRPKTPASGIYAPTKASLARARGEAASIAPAHKTISSSALDGVMSRLAKPTAASASKTRTPAVASTSSRSVVPKPARGAAPSRGVASPKQRISTTSSRAQMEQNKKGASSTAKVAVAKKPAKVETGAADVTLSSTTSEVEQIDRSQSSISVPDTEEYVEQVSQVLKIERSDANRDSDIESYDDAFASDDEHGVLDKPDTTAPRVEFNPSKDDTVNTIPEAERTAAPSPERKVDAEVDNWEEDELSENIEKQEKQEFELKAEAAAEREVSGHIPVEDNLASQDDGKSMRTAEVKNSAFDDVVDMLQFKPTPLSVSTFLFVTFSGSHSPSL